MKRSIVEIGLTVALALVLAAVKIFHMPMGGEISLGILPILILSLWRGAAPGMTAGLLYGLAHYVQDPFIIHPVQFLLDYPVAHALLGLSGIFSRLTPPWKAVIPGMIFGVGLDFLCHLISGVVFFKTYMPEINWLGMSFPYNPWLYSFLYNISYILPELIASIILGIPLLSALRRAFR
ncbi:MAG: energy-coupled thiamine transporter ThiT [Chloroflexi bacterium]|nr:energy-coupled thiamine transporter ThiT [Chloroflexota bacterium]